MNDSGINDGDEEAYWRASKEFVRLTISQLNETLKGSKVSAAKRKEICTEFTFGLTNVLDQQWIKADGRTFYPVLCFSEVFQDFSQSSVAFPSASVELHAMVHDEIDWFFEEVRQDSTCVITGNVGDETADTEWEIDDDKPIRQPCARCKGSGKCFCLRKGSGDATGCTRCSATGKCVQCDGTGKPKR